MTTPASGMTPLPWPPPALEPIHGKLWPAIAVLGLADIVLVLPLLVTLGTHQPLGSLGPFGDAFWVPLATTVIGCIALMGGLWRLAQLSWAARAAARAGHGWRTMLAVTADEPRDTGFLLAGARAYASLGPSERTTIVTARIIASSLVLAAVLLMPAAASLSIVLGRLGVAGEGFLWTFSFWIPLVLAAGGVLGNLAARLLARSARRSGPAPAAEHAALKAAVTQWHETLRRLRGDEPVGKAATPRALSAAALGAVLLALLVVAPVGVATLGGTIGAIIASIAAPGFSRAEARLASAQVLRRYTVDPDPSITPEAAGQALHALILAGTEEADRFAAETQPVRPYPEPWWPADSGAIQFTGSQGSLDTLFARGGRLAAQTAFLRRVAAHRAHAEFSLVARAPTMDVIGTRYRLPFGPDVSWVNLPIPRYASLRAGARAHIAKAVIELADGRPAQAERAIREVISVGFRLIDDGPTMIDNMIGVSLVDQGGDALERLYRATGRTDDAETLAWVRTEARAAADRTARGLEKGMSAEAGLRAMPGMVLDSTLANGLRWEFFGTLSAFAPCGNIKAIAFGPGEEYQQWLGWARTSLVHRPSDEALLELFQRGPFGTSGCLPFLGSLRMIGEVR